LVTGAAIAAALSLATGSAHAASPSTTITLKVTGCEGCTIGVQRAITGGNPSKITPATPAFWEGTPVKVKSGVATLKVPTANTSGMSFTITAPWESGTNAVSNIVLGSARPAGSTVTSSQQAKTTQATACWAGTAKTSVTIKVQVVKASMSGGAIAASAWATPTVATVGPLQDSTKGTLGNQEAFYC
jgi:hypothetical protein